MIQVWFDNRKMGTLDVSVPKGQPLVIQERDDLDIEIREFVFSLIPRHRMVDRSDLMVSGRSLDAYIVAELELPPELVKRTEQPHMDAVKLSWPTVVARDIDEYEFLFDQHKFIPA